MRRTALATLLVAGQLVAKTMAHAPNKPQIRVMTSLFNFDACIMDQWGNGGGANWTIHLPSIHRTRIRWWIRVIFAIRERLGVGIPTV